MNAEVSGQRSEVRLRPASALALSRRDRAGLTLFEVVISLAILLGALAVLGQLISVGSRAAVRTNLHSHATRLCQAKLADVLAGVELLQPTAGLPADPFDPEWMWSLDVAPGPHPDLIAIAVTVQHVDPLREADSTVTLYRIMRRPELFQEWANTLAEEAAAEAEAEAATP